jgi:hypothetical protein
VRKCSLNGRPVTTGPTSVASSSDTARTTAARSSTLENGRPAGASARTRAGPSTPPGAGGEHAELRIPGSAVEQAVVAEDDRRARPGDLAIDREPAGFLVTHAPSRGVPLASQR